MTEDLAAQFAQMQQYTAALHELLNAAQDHAPRHAEGADRSDAVRITLGRDGLPTSFRVGSDWTSKIAPAAFGGAVLDAFQAAMNDRMRTWTRSLTQDGWRHRANHLSGPAAVSGGQIPAAFRKPVVEQVTPRPIGEIAEDVFKAFDKVDRLAATPTPEPASGTDGSGKLTITLSSTALTSCTVDERWVAGQSAAQLMNALGQALAAAKQSLSRQAQRPNPLSGVDGLFAEAMALLNDPRRLAD